MHATLTKPSLVHYSSFICLFALNRPPVGDELCVHLWYDSANHPSAGHDPYDWPEVVQPELWEPDANSVAHHFLSALNSGANLFYVSIELAEIFLVKILSFYVLSAWIEFLIFVKSFALLHWMIASQHSPGFPDFYLLLCVCVCARALWQTRFALVVVPVVDLGPFSNDCNKSGNDDDGGGNSICSFSQIWQVQH
jgi:hypothetical protein